MPQHGLTVDLSIAVESLELPNDQAMLLYQSVRELLMNLVKHAGVYRAVVSLTTDGDKVVIVVSDLGRGFDASAKQPLKGGEHFGLPSVKERMSTVCGTYLLESVIGRGTTITLQVPIQQPEAVLTRAARASQHDRVKIK